ncbi:uncharacterized protein LOC117175684 [Belonocnema kinseyi]|uniref:uncharacterized protein LOC117175684 n=1 Tax=Belonocnema kinseyi TaxID=2817044 RepID=UPI00143D36BB|nr:uncharacterized protein LOC117175684 [Belonocnema kinseyi]
MIGSKLVYIMFIEQCDQEPEAPRARWRASRSKEGREACQNPWGPLNKKATCGVAVIPLTTLLSHNLPHKMFPFGDSCRKQETTSVRKRWIYKEPESDIPIQQPISS